MTARDDEMKRLLEEQRADVIYGMSSLKIAQARLERELIRIEDALQDLRSEDITDDKGTIE